jgi:hypothetical protein
MIVRKKERERKKLKSYMLDGTHRSGSVRSVPFEARLFAARCKYVCSGPALQVQGPILEAQRKLYGAKQTGPAAE